MVERAFAKITDERWAVLCGLIAGGHHKRAACYASGISAAMFYRYLRVCETERAEGAENEYTKRLGQYEAALARDIQGLESVVRRSPQGAMFLLERRYPDLYARVDAQVTPEMAEKLVQVLEAIRDGALERHEVAEQLGDNLAERLFRVAGVDIAEPAEPEQAGPDTPGQSG